ncbi:hypothetical protein OYT88_05365 [Sporolactobacillus sp. CQH2019]|uniref:hypothetical protein n=1 Tax=Sporolactobacillus sp. CQH2019 TaxID=3023512 RepID=UPI0023679CD9|nr:hypothetical protein [Sporolactobacillus sp. CQH2019]MDD9147975.1 hypothetical protein [Sporolactobacillus sp. CQH2019]
MTDKPAPMIDKLAMMTDKTSTPTDKRAIVIDKPAMMTDKAPPPTDKSALRVAHRAVFLNGIILQKNGARFLRRFPKNLAHG